MTDPAAPPAGAVRRWPRRLRRLAVAGLVVLLLASLPWLWTTFSARGHRYDESDAPAADVVIVLGTAVAADRQRPGERLAGRLETAAGLVTGGRATVVLVSGDGGGASGDEPAVMTTYLAELGVDPRRVVADPFGLDTYDSCARAREVYGVQRALIVTQSYHLSRAVTLCRHLGLDVDGVTARCDGCGPALLAEKSIRDYFASGKAALDAVRDRPPAVRSPADPAIEQALRS
ncbi:SanA/YdcF family protein [Micromonospora tarensis]|uniref:YdcF family protein n=1 Tax=Micromonospora tarensis TaxID=2806100 RepID=A0ABS1YQZ9_9ACTN|nr:ElyC/SanA/YdcF family protein [Micromonospora tarensis]MBM0279718.1 YdcF family protein [Micromonospora tarensis]